MALEWISQRKAKEPNNTKHLHNEWITQSTSQKKIKATTQQADTAKEIKENKANPCPIRL